ncbi:hypothetical protein GLOTRDRAFT_115070 [Gloeophyllum trabeum ATCC 11539]|uniref:Uncharacterized protein n=1 Tax=Gloeophyllum trabeum (strain ATCC 11539 / FP-39264 / Madison 617) TaxID=670483 RepID=S7RQT2_GLOTA|nr:uncharacterized protein GLOTRDRAFT_115070 [Gloeophyllum trabeum ATCC 11539]EPQ56935.1 hypothetical protein GLOTRDRAFT_115070 [Gloeophyllum trabeum ATCC 11539]
MDPPTSAANEKTAHDPAVAVDTVQPIAATTSANDAAVEPGGSTIDTSEKTSNDSVRAIDPPVPTVMAPDHPNGIPPALPPRRVASTISYEKSIPPSYTPADQSLHPSSSTHQRTPSGSSLSSNTSTLDTPDPVSASLPPATHPTVALLIPFPPPSHATDKQASKLPPFVLYAPLAAPLQKPQEGEKEGLAHKAQRKWQEEERGARERGTGFKAKAVGLISKGMAATKNSRIEFLVRTPNKKKLKELRMIYPASYSAADIKDLFTDMIKKAKAGAIRNGIVSTAMLPFVLAFDVFTFISGPFEINAVWAASSWTGAAQASAISSRVTSSELPLSFASDARLNVLAYRLHEICWRKARAGAVEKPRWTGTDPIRRGPDLAGLVLDVLRAHGEDMGDLETNRTLVGEDLERCLKKGAKEWAKVLA